MQVVSRNAVYILSLHYQDFAVSILNLKTGPGKHGGGLKKIIIILKLMRPGSWYPRSVLWPTPPTVQQVLHLSRVVMRMII